MDTRDDGARDDVRFEDKQSMIVYDFPLYLSDPKNQHHWSNNTTYSVKLCSYHSAVHSKLITLFAQLPPSPIRPLRFCTPVYVSEEEAELPFVRSNACNLLVCQYVGISSMQG